VDAGRFRSDLFYRMNVVELHVPPLRERREDIPYLTAAFVKEFAGRFGKSIEGVSSGAEQILMSGAWLGNVRELRNLLERVCMLAEGPVLTERDVAGVMPAVREAPAAPAYAPVASPAQDLEHVEREHIVRVLADVKGNKQAAARRLGISRRTLYRRLERHGLLDAPAD
jgi:DNA-binding NtrC family response regulator